MDDKLIEKAADEMAENSWIRQQCFIADIEECIEAAKIANSAGISMLIVNGKNIDTLYDIIDGKKVGTLFKAY